MYMKPKSGSTILDVGFNDEEYSATDNYLEKNYPHLDNVTALGIESGEKFAERYPDVNTVTYDGKIFPFADQSFDICWSNAVLEHVGERSDQIRFLQEAKRAAKKSFITTPNKYFPIEVHTRIPLLHLVSNRLFESTARLIGKDWATGDYMNLLGARDLKKILKDAGIVEYKIIKNSFFGFVLDFVIIF